MMSLSPVMKDHVARLSEEMLDLEHDKRKLTKGLRLAHDDCCQHKIYYAYLLKKQELFVKHIRAQREELYNAVMSGDATRIAKIEVKMIASNKKAYEIQLQIPTRLKHFTEAIKREQEYEEAICSIRHRMILKSEEIHKYRPCEIFLCDHCRGKTEKRLCKQTRRRYKEEVEGMYEEAKQSQSMMSRVFSKMRQMSF
ncbi:hypothetical protein N0V93_009520 [Gnomoniopsis smithogilvyi]|uniref:Uncharacterized protein n=1 Tax=Gnomoniopsis smithogilvyi TaxID=1191159 RepID=A0A9W9CTS0_9PEZI|nr:hypothetical protein N0V93_009520 [Gnomoniopsis smithogilvyi]